MSSPRSPTTILRHHQEEGLTLKVIKKRLMGVISYQKPSCTEYVMAGPKLSKVEVWTAQYWWRRATEVPPESSKVEFWGGGGQVRCMGGRRWSVRGRLWRRSYWSHLLQLPGENIFLSYQRTRVETNISEWKYEHVSWRLKGALQNCEM